jgi:rSAM/selenodomain-associated transferase 1
VPIERCAVGVMARAPSAAGKTRLAPHLSPARLAALRAALLADTLDVVGGASRTVSMDAVLFFTPAGAEPEIAALTNHVFPCVCQSDGDLGQRMRAALEELLGPRGYGAAVLVGADIPLLNARHLVEARDTLHSSGGLVLGPADDGGYYLIGVTHVHDGLFEEIEWGTSSVLTDTLRAAERLGIEARLIGGTYDVDTIEDLRRLERDLASAASGIAPHVRRWFLEGASP